MRGVVFSGPERPLELAELELAPPRPGEVLVRIAAAGVCRSDLHSRQGDWPRRTPLVMGHEGAGTVIEVGAEVSGLAPGDHVVLSWQPACGRCRPCLLGLPQRCQLMASLVAPQGVLYDGTSRLSRRGETVYHYSGVSSFAEEAVVPATGAIAVPADVPLSSAALIGCCVSTGVGAVLWTARVEEGATVAVVGCGAVGLSAVEGAVLASAARIIAIDPLEQKLQLARELGATDALAARSTEAVGQVRELTRGGADYVFDCIGLSETVSDSIRMLAVGGTAVLVGLPAVGQEAHFSPLEVGESERRIVGSYYGSCRPAVHFPYLAELYLQGRLRIDQLVTRRRPLEEAEAALDDLERGREIKTVLEPGAARRA